MNWYAIRVSANHEYVAQRSLTGRGYETFLPLYSPVAGSTTARKPLFPGYVFARFDFHDRFPVVSSPGVMGVVGYGKLPAEVAEDEIAAVRTMVESGAAIFPWPYLKAGQRVRVVRGPLMGVEGVVTEFRGAARVVASIGLLERSVAAELDRSWLDPT